VRRALDQRMRERQPRPREPPVADRRGALVDRRRERQLLAPRERHHALLQRPPRPGAGLLRELGDLGRQPLLDRRELAGDEVARRLGLRLQLAVDGRARDDRGADRRERHDERERQRERHERLRAQGQRGARRRRSRRARSSPEPHVVHVGALRRTSIARGRTVEVGLDDQPLLGPAQVGDDAPAARRRPRHLQIRARRRSIGLSPMKCLLDSHGPERRAGPCDRSNAWV
jgi:hypothetical protein